MRLSPGLAVWSPKAELNRCLWLIEARGRTAHSLRSWSDARAQSSPPATDRQPGGGQWGALMGPFPHASEMPSCFHKTVSRENCYLQALCNFPIRITGCVWREIEFETLLCNRITFLWICEWVSDTFSGFEIADEIAACDSSRFPGDKVSYGHFQTANPGFRGPTQDLGAPTMVLKVTSVSYPPTLSLPPAVPAECSGWRSPPARPVPITATPRSPLSPHTAPAPP